MDLSLDDYIKNKKSSRPERRPINDRFRERRGRGRGYRGGRGRGRGDRDGFRDNYRRNDYVRLMNEPLEKEKIQ